jgi:xylose isomerase
MDTLARGLLIANDILTSSDYVDLRKNRYKSFNKGAGKTFAKGKIDLEELSKLALNQPEPSLTSGKQELFESLVNKYI